MIYYSVNKSYIKKVIGNYPQKVDIKVNGNINSELLIDRFFLKKIDFEPLVPNAILHKKANLTDLIASDGVGFSFALLISSKLKNIFENFNIENFQFFKSNLIQDGKEICGYWLMNPTREYLEKVDFKKSEIYVSKIALLEPININSLNHFLEVENELKTVGFKGEKGTFGLSFNKIIFKEFNTTPLLYLRRKRGSSYYVSKELKEAIEEANCSGIEFMPSDMPFSEWSAPGGYREKVYGYK